MLRSWVSVCRWLYVTEDDIKNLPCFQVSAANVCWVVCVCKLASTRSSDDCMVFYCGLGKCFCPLCKVGLRA
jgi:hypothetical protein